MEALRLTSPQGPHPFKLEIPSREPRRKIPLYVFVPPVRFPDVDSGNVEPTPHTFPVVMDYHGGGFYLGSCLEQAPFCAKLCRELQTIVIGVDYRMAPIHKFPAAIEDSEDAALAVLDPEYAGYSVLRAGIADFLRRKWFETLGTPDDRKKGKIPLPPVPQMYLDEARIAFSGASSGGNIALNMAISAPASLDLRQLPDERLRRENMPALPEKKRLDIDNHLAATYVSREMSAHPRASPGLVDASVYLHKNAKILLILSGLDTLWEQSEIWVKKVEAEGRIDHMKVMRYEDRKHGWTTIPEIALSKEERKTRLEVLEECVRFTDVAWQGRDPVAVMNKEMGDNVKAQGNAELKHHEEEGLRFAESERKSFESDT
ncbi:hypothetical protein LTS10_004700 [Elasticomyces elasticus]|nr:hypothetical protein LTS10_004700 [Elasticomyces elasticus]